MSNKLSIKEIKTVLAQVIDINDPLLNIHQEDPRKGVQLAVNQTIKRIRKNEDIFQKHQQKLEYEVMLKEKGYQMIAGIDEVGRGPLAGPIVTAAVILPDNCDALIGVNDSKQLSQSKRKEFAERIKNHAISYSITITPVEEIDRLNIYEATRHSMVMSVNQLSVTPDHLLIDAMTIESEIPQLSLIKGDAKSLSIAAASILAKEYRDQLMIDYALTYPEFGFESHMGYGTKQHLDAIDQFGITPIHRRSFAPVAQAKTIYQKK